MPDDTVPDFEPAKTSSIFDPPKRGPAKDKAPSQPKPKGRPNTHDRRKEKLLTLLSTVGSAVLFFEQTDGTIILTNAENLAEATATLADEVPAVAKAIDAMSTGGAWGGFLLAIAAMIIPILSHHKILPEIANAFIPQDITSQAA